MCAVTELNDAGPHHCQLTPGVGQDAFSTSVSPWHGSVADAIAAAGIPMAVSVTGPITFEEQPNVSVTLMAVIAPGPSPPITIEPPAFAVSATTTGAGAA